MELPPCAHCGLPEADMVASVGGLACAFNSTVYEDTLHEVPELVEWAGRNVGKVHTMVFILYRAAALAKFDYYAGGKKVDVSELVDGSAPTGRTVNWSRTVRSSPRRASASGSPCCWRRKPSAPTTPR